MLDADLAELYNVSTNRFNEAVRQNTSRLPADFMFQLTADEAEILRSPKRLLTLACRSQGRISLPAGEPPPHFRILGSRTNGVGLAGRNLLDWALIVGML